MTVYHNKSTPIANLDNLVTGGPAPIANTSGQGASDRLKSVSATMVVATTQGTGSTFQLVRVPSNAILKHVFFGSDAQGAGTFDLSVYYSDSTVDGTASANQGLVVPTTGATFIADAIVCASAVQWADYLGYGGTAAGWDFADINLPLWSALGLTTDPGGFFDIVAVCTDTAITTGTGSIAIEVQYAQ